MKTIILYGDLRKKFGREFRLNVSSGSEAIRALCKLVKGFESYFIEHSEPGFHVKVGKEYIESDTLGEPSGREVIRISPYIAGSKGALKIIVGVILIAAAVYLGPGFSAMGGLITSGGMMSFGVSMVLGGISELLFTPPVPTSSSSKEPNARPSYSFDGPENTVRQGNPVPLCYGKLMVGSQVISAVTISKDI